MKLCDKGPEEEQNQKGIIILVYIVIYFRRPGQCESLVSWRIK